MSTDVRAAVLARGALRTAVSRGIRGLSWQDDDGRWRGLDVDVARAIAAAVLGDPDAVECVPVDPGDRLPVLAEGLVDTATCNLTWTLGRESEWPVLFAGVSCYDGEGFLVGRESEITRPADLAGRRVAVQSGTTSAQNLAAWFGDRGLQVEAVAYPTPSAALAGYATSECAAYVLDRTALAGERTRLPAPEAHVLLDETISREPMALAVGDRDVQWFRLCRWVLQLLIAAEADTRAAEKAARHGPAIGLDEGWAARVVDAVGCYADVYHRNLGERSDLQLPRGLNNLWCNGGLHYALPMH